MNHHEQTNPGFIPGPDEDRDSFEERVSYCLGLKETIPSEGETVLDSPCRTVMKRYDIAPAWVPVLYSNHKLMPWHGGCAWIFQMEKEAPLGAYMQLRRSLKKRDKLMGLYSRDELIAHELCHVGRMAFEEPGFEELFAYRISKGWRSWLGPIVTSSGESMLFVLSLVLLLFFQLFALFVDPTAFTLAAWFSLVPIGFVLLGIIRLYLRHRQLDRCIAVLKTLFGEKAEAVAFRLTDREIKNCRSGKDFARYITEQSSLRWQTIKNRYPMENNRATLTALADD